MISGIYNGLFAIITILHNLNVIEDVYDHIKFYNGGILIPGTENIHF